MAPADPRHRRRRAAAHAASLATKAAAPSRRGEVLGRLDAAGSACRVIAPAITGLLIDAAGLQAAFAAQAALCFVGIAILRVWAAARLY